MSHGHLHKTLSVSIDRGQVFVWALFLMLLGYAFSALMAELLGEYSHLTRFFVYSVSAVSVLLLMSVITRGLRAIQTWLEDLERRAEEQPSEVGMGTRLLLYGYAASNNSGHVIYQPRRATDIFVDIEQQPLCTKPIAVEPVKSQIQSPVAAVLSPSQRQQQQALHTQRMTQQLQAQQVQQAQQADDMRPIRGYP